MSETIPRLIADGGQSNAEVVVNDNAKSAGPVLMYAKHPPSCSALVWGVYGGDWQGSTIGTLYSTTQTYHTTVSLTDASTNYVVANRSTGAVSTSTANTNWNNTGTYGRLQIVTTAGGVVTAMADWRFQLGGIFNHSAGAGAVLAGSVSITDAGGYYTGTEVETALQEIGAALQSAGKVPAQRYTIELANTTDSDPGAGLVKFDNATPASATFLYIDDSTSDGVDLSTLFASFGASGFVKIQSVADAGEWAIFKWAVTPTDGTGYWKFAVTPQASKGTLDDGDAVLIEFDSGGGGGGGDADDITYTPTTLADWDASADPGDVEQALDQLAERVTDIEVAGPGSTQGLHDIWIAAGSWYADYTAPPTWGVSDGASDQPDFAYWLFDPTTEQAVYTILELPKKWNEGTITFHAQWLHGATVTNFGVVWSLRAVAFSNDDASAANYGTAQTSTDTGGTTLDIYSSPESAAITIAGTPATRDLVLLELRRKPGDGSDTLAVNAGLLGATIQVTTDAGTDA
jgi:hypothetical protein